MPQHKLMKKSAPKFKDQKQTVAKMQKVNSRKAHKAGMVMKKKKKTANDKLRSKLKGAITVNIEQEMANRAGASSACNLKIVKPEEKTDKKEAK